ncbi:hypothetical protein [Mariniflexile sp. HMF6888]|uniref:hypothetical protein n=1 Tax=Mariniflexile sp. HMF6888 TaxID=3373086 RepID=UPI00379B2A97
MNKLKIIFAILLTSSIYGCKESLLYSNKNDSCELYLYEDKTYKFKYPNFFENKTEKGTYEVDNSKITLIRKSSTKIDSVDIGYGCWEDNPDSLLLTFKNLYREPINAIVKFNNYDREFKTNSLGEINISYRDLENQRIVGKNNEIDKYTIEFQNKVYIPDMTYYKDSRKPNKIDFKLNQFVGEEFVILKRTYNINNNTIFVNDISRKVIGRDNKLIKVK